MASWLLLYAKNRLEFKLGGRRRGDHDLTPTLLGRTLGERARATRDFDERRPHLECRAAGRVGDDLHALRCETVRSLLERSVGIQMPLDFLRLALLNDVS